MIILWVVCLKYNSWSRNICTSRSLCRIISLMLLRWKSFSLLQLQHKALLHISFHSDPFLLTENNLGFRVRDDLTAGGLLILLLHVACLHLTLTDYREPPSMRQGMLWCDKWPGAKWCFVCLPTCPQRPQFIHNTGGGAGCRCVSVWKKERIIEVQWERESGNSQQSLGMYASQVQHLLPFLCLNRKSKEMLICTPCCEIMIFIFHGYTALMAYLLGENTTRQTLMMLQQRQFQLLITITTLMLHQGIVSCANTFFSA